MIKKSLFKIISLLLIIGLNWTGLLAIGQTFAYFNDTEISADNIFQAGVLDMTVRSGQNNFTPNAENMMHGDQVNRDIYIGKTADSSSLKHKVSYEFIDDDESLCNQLDLKIWYDHYKCQGSYEDCRDMRLTYNDKLSSLANYTHNDFEIPHPDDQFDTNSNDGTEQWFYYSIIVPNDIDDSFQGKVCNFNFVYEAWQTNFPDSSQGFTDEEKLESTIKTGYWKPPVVLNEFLPNAGNYPEFIELYNKTGSSIDLAGFYIKANDTTIPIDTLTTDAYSGGFTEIPANGWLVVTTGGGMLDDTSGTVTLYNPNDVEVDSYTYDASDYNINNTPGWTNNLVGYWPFDNDVQDKSGNGNDGINNGVTFTDSGKINQGLSLDGDDNVVVNDAPSLKPTLVTLEAWVRRLGSPGSYRYIAGKNYSGGYGSYNLYTGGTGGLKFYIGHNSGYVASSDAGLEIWDGNWHHVVGIYNGSKVKLYMDGVEVGTGKSTNVDIIYNDSKFYIGSYGNGYYFNGDIDEVKIYDRALSDSEILQHYNDVSSSGAVPVDKSYARIPDGTDNWVDPFPTPGGPNTLGREIINQEDAIEETLSVEEEPIEEPIDKMIEGPVIEEEPTDIEATTTEATTTEATTTDATTTEEEITTTTEETIIAEVTTETSGETTEDVIEEVVEEVTDEPTIDEIGEEAVEEIIEETPVIEEPVIEEPVIEEPIEETTDEVVDESIINVVVEPEPEQIEETLAEVINETPVVDETPADETSTDETYE